MFGRGSQFQYGTDNMGSMMAAGTWLIVAVLICFVLLLTVWKEKVSFPRLCFVGAITFVLSVVLPIFATSLVSIVAQSTATGPRAFQNSMGPETFSGMMLMIMMMISPLLLGISLLLLVCSIFPRQNKQRTSPVSTASKPVAEPKPIDPFQ